MDFDMGNGRTSGFGWMQWCFGLFEGARSLGTSIAVPLIGGNWDILCADEFMVARA